MYKKAPNAVMGSLSCTLTQYQSRILTLSAIYPESFDTLADCQETTRMS